MIEYFFLDFHWVVDRQTDRQTSIAHNFILSCENVKNEKYIQHFSHTGVSKNKIQNVGHDFIYIGLTRCCYKARGSLKIDLML